MRRLPPWVGSSSTSKTRRPPRREDVARCQQREVAEVLVVDRVELDALDHPQQVRHLERDHARRASAPPRARRRSRSARHVGEDVVADHQVGGEAVARPAPARRRARRTRPRSGCRRPARPRPRSPPARRPAPGSRRRRSSSAGSRRCWPPRAPATTGVEAESLRRGLRVPRGVLEPALRVRREVGVGVREDRLRRDDLVGLDEQAARRRRGRAAGSAGRLRPRAARASGSRSRAAARRGR